MQKGLYIVATPIGNLSDISQRAIDVLKKVDVVACEDTRITKKLFSLLGIGLNKSFISLHNFNEAEKADYVISLITEQEKTVALVSDAGSPLISDPGYKLIKKCRSEGVYITTIPGCCALISALQLSGLPSDRFCFVGFIPNKDKARKDLFKEFANVKSTLIFYETSQRIEKSIIAAKEVFGSREFAVVREVTKMHEEAITGSADEILEHIKGHGIKGELVFLVSPPNNTEQISEQDIEDYLAKAMKTQTLKDAVNEISDRFGLSKKKVYSLAVRLRDE